jgi:hypothetical protein
MKESLDVKRQIYQCYDFTAKAFGIDDIHTVDLDGTCTVDPPNLFGSLEEILKKFSDLEPVYISERGGTDLKEFVHPEKALYITGPNYTGMRIPDGAKVVSIKASSLYPSSPLWAHVALGIVLSDRIYKEG